MGSSFDGIEGPRRFWDDDHKVINWFRDHFPTSTWTSEQIVKWVKANFKPDAPPPIDWRTRRTDVTDIVSPTSN